MTDMIAYREDAHRWLTSQASNFGREARRHLTEDEDIALGRRWQRAKFDAGYAGITLSKEHGGQGLSPLEKLIFEQEEARFGFPSNYFAITMGMPVPIMLRYAPEEIRNEVAKAALRGDAIWCQLFSEPSAGSDLAGLQLRAVRDGDGWVLNGQKLWTSWAHKADYGIILARTDPTVPKHRGITFFWLDMKQPGITVRPVRLMHGEHDVNEVFFDDVRIADIQRLGPVGGGFGVALETLVIERYSATDPAGFGPHLSLLISQAEEVKLGGRAAIEDGRVRREIARAYAMRSALESIHKRALLALASGMRPGPEGAIHKLVSVRSRQRLSEFAMDMQGMSSIRYHHNAFSQENWTVSWLAAPTGRIAGGADEMLLNTIAERILGLPQDYRPDKGIPFNQIPR